MDKFGFIILRHVNSTETNKYWQESYHCIRKIYPTNKIVIIDDDSNPVYLTVISMINTIIFESEFKKRGELLPYYYYLQNKWFENAVILHDSVFIKADIVTKYVKYNVPYKMLWHFITHLQDQDNYILPLIFSLNNSSQLLDFYNSKKWNGCFGGMAIINHDFLTYLNNKYNICNLLSKITTRDDRIAFERVIACMVQCEDKKIQIGILQDILAYCQWGYSFDAYLNDLNCLGGDGLNKLHKYPVIKVWTGR